MKGDYINYDNFLLIDLIEEISTRFINRISYDMTLHGMIIAGKDYDGICKLIREYLENDDKEE